MNGSQWEFAISFIFNLLSSLCWFSYPETPQSAEMSSCTCITHHHICVDGKQMFAMDSGMNLKVCICIVVIVVKNKTKRRAKTKTATSVKADWIILVNRRPRGMCEAWNPNTNDIGRNWTYLVRAITGYNKGEDRACRVKKPPWKAKSGRIPMTVVCRLIRKRSGGYTNSSLSVSQGQI